MICTLELVYNPCMVAGGKHREISVAIFIDKDRNIFLQNRKGHSRVGENYGFFGGGVELGETIEEALLRELKEELNYFPKEYKMLGFHEFTVAESGIYKDWAVRVNYFVSPLTKNLQNSIVKEGLKYEIIPLDTALTPIYLSKYDIEGVTKLKGLLTEYATKLA